MPSQCEICRREVLDPKAEVVIDGSGRVWHVFCLKAALASYTYDSRRMEFVKKNGPQTGPREAGR
jgi:hypothetical protein